MSKLKKFIFFLSALIPGAGHMCLGLMKRGLILMTLFFLNVGLAMILDGFIVFLPVVWFYCLFDAWNKSFLKPEELRKVDDSFIFFYNAIPEEIMPKSKIFKDQIPQKVFKGFGVVLVFFGIVMFCHELTKHINLPGIVKNILDFVPEMLISLSLVVLGICLIIHKKKELYSSDFDDSSLLDDTYKGAKENENAPKKSEKDEIECVWSSTIEEELNRL